MALDGASWSFEVHPYGGLCDLQIGQAAKVLWIEESRDTLSRSLGKKSWKDLFIQAKLSTWNHLGDLWGSNILGVQKQTEAFAIMYSSIL